MDPTPKRIPVQSQGSLSDSLTRILQIKKYRMAKSTSGRNEACARTVSSIPIPRNTA